jgi:hypothetical protein
MSLGDLANARIDTLTQRNAELVAQNIIHQTDITIIQNLIDNAGVKLSDDVLKASLSSQKYMLLSNVGSNDNQIASNNNNIASINSSLALLSQNDKDFSYLILTTYRFIPDLFNFNVKESFVDQIRSIYDNNSMSTEVKANIINGLLRNYDPTKYE